MKPIVQDFGIRADKIKDFFNQKSLVTKMEAKTMNKKNRTVSFIKIIFLINVLILLIGSFANAEESYTKTAEIICGNVKVELITKCFDDTLPHFVFCTEQYFKFTDQKTGKVINKRASGILVTSKDLKGKMVNKYLGALAGSWGCVKGREKSYIIVGYYTGGNCEECEWFEIYGLDGKSLTSSKGKNIKQYKEEFIRTYDRLGLPKPWPRSSFIDIKLSNDNK